MNRPDAAKRQIRDSKTESWPDKLQGKQQSDDHPDDTPKKRRVGKVLHDLVVVIKGLIFHIIFDLVNDHLDYLELKQPWTWIPQAFHHQRESLQKHCRGRHTARYGQTKRMQPEIRLQPQH